MVLDHLCRNRACVRLDHLEAVTDRENLLRGVGIAAQKGRRTTCPRGHAYDRTRQVNGKPARECAACRRKLDRERQKRKYWAKKRLLAEGEKK